MKKRKITMGSIFTILLFIIFISNIFVFFSFDQQNIPAYNVYRNTERSSDYLFGQSTTIIDGVSALSVQENIQHPANMALEHYNDNNTRFKFNKETTSAASYVYYELTFTVVPSSGGQAIDETNAGPYVAGEQVSIRAEANPGYVFTNWTASAGSFVYATSPSTTFTMPEQDITVIANFESLVTHLVTFSVQSGEGSLTANLDGVEISSGELVPPGSTVNFVAVSSTGYRVTDWIVNGITQGIDDFSYTASNLEDDVDVKVVFEPISEDYEHLSKQVRDYLKDQFYNLLVMKEYFGTISTEDETTITQTYDVSGGMDIAIAAGFDSNNLRVSVYGPDGDLFAVIESHSSPVMVVVQNAKPGIWSFIATGIDLQDSDYPYVVVIGEFLYGDINNDRMINVLDVLAVAKHLRDLKSIPDYKKNVADVNGNGTIDFEDVELIMHKALGLIEEFPLAPQEDPTDND